MNVTSINKLNRGGLNLRKTRIEHMAENSSINQFDVGHKRRMEQLKLPVELFMKTPIACNANIRPGTASSSVKRNSRKGSGGYNTGPTESSTTPSTTVAQSVIIAITEGRGDARGEVGIAALNLQHPHLIICQISDRQTYVHTLTKILVFKPKEIIMPDTMVHANGTANDLYKCVKDKFKDLTITAVPRKHFNNELGLDRIKTLCAREYSSIRIYVRQKFYAQAAAAALLKYVEFIQHMLFIPRAMKIEFQCSEDTTVIDIESAESLELVTTQAISSKSTLLSILDRCVTPGGKRYLRASILQPPSNREVILSRQSCVTEMVEDSTLLTSVQSLVRKLSGVDRTLLLGLNDLSGDSVASAEKNLNYVLLLKSILEIVPSLKTALENANAKFFKQVRENLQDPRFELMTKIISHIVQSEACYTPGFIYSVIQRCFALKSGINDMLDIARQTYCELIDDMNGLVDALARKFNLPLSLECSAALGYHILMEGSKNRVVKTNDLPPIFIEVQKRKNIYYMTTENLLVLSQRCKDACEEVHLMSNVMLTRVLNDLREHIGCLYQLSADVAELDVVVSFARISSNANYIKPTFGSRLEIINCVHPIMDMNGSCIPVGNDVSASVDHNFNVITGPNMGGKSVYLRQIVMLQIMAQIGCYVPAEKAQFRIADQILCRIGFGDSIDCNTSSFSLEMKETQYILQMVSPKSLIIMDELCRGTNTEEGETIAFAISESLLNTSAFTFFTTHFLSLARLADWYPNVTNYHFETKYRAVAGSTESRLIYTHKLKPGIVFVKHYGLALSDHSGMPSSVLNMAKDIIEKLDEKMKDKNTLQGTSLVESKKCYEQTSKMYKLVEDGEFTVSNLVKIINISQLDRASKFNEDGHPCSGNSPAPPTPSGLVIKNDAKCNPDETIFKTPITHCNDRQKLLIKSGAFKRHFQELAAASTSAAKNVDSQCKSPFKTFVTPEIPRTISASNVTSTPNHGQLSFNHSLSNSTASKLSTNSSHAFCLDMDIDEGDQRSNYFKCSLERTSSMGTIDARISARNKEASIFRLIEGDEFRESQFYGSILSPQSSLCIIESEEGPSNN